MAELRIDLKREEQGCIPVHLAGLSLDFNKALVVYWGRVMCSTDPGDCYMLYPLEFSNQPGLFTFGIKDAYTPHCHPPSICVTLDTVNMEWHVDRLSSDWVHAVEAMAEDDATCEVVFYFTEP